MAISVITRFASAQALMRNATVNSSVCTSYLTTAKHLNARSRFSSTATRGNEYEDEIVDNESAKNSKPVFMSAQMRRYLERAKAHEDFMKTQIAEYEIGLRHLANIMGKDVETIKKTGTKEYIQYLFPSGLYEKKARPILEHPSVLFPAKKEAEFDYTGRPHNSFFYTTRPNYYKLLHDIAGWIEDLNHTQYWANKSDKENVEGKKIELQELIPREKEDLEAELFEKLTEKQYEYFLSSMEALIEHPFSESARKFITKYFKQKREVKSTIRIPTIEYDTNKRRFVRVTNCSRKSTRGEVIVYADGTGQITVNGQDLLYFREQHFREQVST